MIDSLYYTLFELSSDPTPEELKRAYHEQAKKNHPDLFPEDQRHLQQLKMMKINEAYLVLSQDINRQQVSRGDRSSWGRDGNFGKADQGRSPHAGPGNRTSRTPEEDSSARENGAPQNTLGHLKDPAYTYYKLGFEYYKKGYSSLYRRTQAKDNSELVKMISSDSYILKLSIQALQYFQKAYRYFHRVITDYPECVWVRDSRYKLWRIEGFNRIYQRICQNISQALKKKTVRKV